MEVEDTLSAAGVLELARSTGLLSWDATNRGWYDAESGEAVPEHEIADRYEDAVRERVGVRRYADDDDMVDNSAPLLASVYLDQDLTFTVSGQAEAQAMRDADPEHTVIAQDAEGEWTVTRKAGTQVRVPRKMKLTRTVGGQIPTGFDPTVWGVPAEYGDRLREVEPGDKIVFYGSDTGFALCEVKSRAFRDEHALWPDGPYPYRVKVTPPLKRNLAEDFRGIYRHLHDRNGQPYASPQAAGRAIGGRGGVFRRLQRAEVAGLLRGLGWQ